MQKSRGAKAVESGTSVEGDVEAEGLVAGVGELADDALDPAAELAARRRLEPAVLRLDQQRRQRAGRDPASGFEPVGGGEGRVGRRSRSATAGQPSRAAGRGTLRAPMPASTASTARWRWSPARPAGSASRPRARCTCAAPRWRSSTSTPTRRSEAAERIGERAIGIGADVTDHGAMMAAVAEVVEKLRRARRRRRQRRHRPEGVRDRPRRSPARNGSGSSRSTCSASGARSGRHCRRSSSAAARWSSSPPSTPSPTASATAPTRSPSPGSSRSAGRCGSSWRPHGRERHRRLLRLGRHETGPGRLRPGRRPPGSASSRPDFLLKRITPAEAARASCAGSKSGHRASSSRSGGATSRPSAA